MLVVVPKEQLGIIFCNAPESILEQIELQEAKYYSVLHCAITFKDNSFSVYNMIWYLQCLKTSLLLLSLFACYCRANT